MKHISRTLTMILALCMLLVGSAFAEVNLESTVPIVTEPLCASIAFVPAWAMVTSEYNEDTFWEIRYLRDVTGMDLKFMRATPDGRYDGENISFGAGQTGGRDRNGLTAMLNSVANMSKTHIMCGPTVTNVMLDESLIRDDVKFEKTVDLIEAYFRKGGLHIQLNYVSREELIAAQKEPEKHENLRVRVSGFSGYYTLLDPEHQQEIIERTHQEK